MDTEKKRILWADDEIDLLQPHMIFLNERGYEVTPVTNGTDAVSLIRKTPFDAVLLDEMMPGKDGLSTLADIKEINPHIPVIMITKNEEERLMEEAIGQRIDDYLTKPVNPSQILLACKKLFDARQILKDRASRNFVADSSAIRAALSGPMDWPKWVDVYQQMAEWDLELDRLMDAGLRQMYGDQRKECDLEFGRYIERVYAHWLRDEQDSPNLSVDIVPKFVYPHLQQGRQVFFVVIDCMRLDHWLIIQPLLADLYKVESQLYCSILPTATPYSRNSIFSGLFPFEVAGLYPGEWMEGSDEDQSRNRHEHQLLDRQLIEIDPTFKKETRYIKVLDIAEGANLVKKLNTYRSFPLVSVVVNFLDMLAHGRSESELLQEMAPNEAAFRSLVRSWFLHSSLFEMLRRLASTDSVVVLTSDHGSVFGTRATVAHGNRETTTNLRYKCGKNLRCDTRHALHIKEPEDYGLPTFGISTNYIIAKEDYYFVYPSRFHEYERQYRGSFQHGGISLEEMILPVVTLTAK
ncbi:MAG: response regulator [Candidatus Handelsmanbacteria bacterium RIFCSPLOWO2_12_FULL_64_10]|uniref:Response regulator n=1 Tax=Handelsmanbacteria sp. (strain RIFCSPLOWO2_12_FULL_64_10) TaxID=1817868 RepID=A0A1F6C5A9_HANXR|nr:MAG: response regulator [Candidatus Handelsmanbacteria bacterium RIFCSPLOWO2_12_FULL_64_10]